MTAINHARAVDFSTARTTSDLAADFNQLLIEDNAEGVDQSLSFAKLVGNAVDSINSSTETLQSNLISMGNEIAPTAAAGPSQGNDLIKMQRATQDLLGLQQSAVKFSTTVTIASKAVGMGTKCINELTHLQ